MFDFRFYLALLLRRLPYIMVFTVAGTAVGLGLALTLPAEYRASARLVVESEQIPGDLAESTVRTAATEQLQIIEQRIKSRDTLLDMAERLNIYPEAPRGVSTALRPDEIVTDLRERIVIRVSGGTSIRRGPANALLVSVSFTDSSATTAAEVTNDVVTLMQDENRAIRTVVTGETLSFFEQEVERLNEELSRRGENIIRFQEANRDALPESVEFRRNQLLRRQEELLELTRDEVELSDQRDAALALFERTGGVEDGGDLAGLTPEERQLRQLRERYTTSVAVLSLDNPRVQVLKAQIDALERLVQTQAAASSAANVDQNNAATSTRTSLFDLEIAEMESRLDFLSSRREQLSVEMAELQTTIEATPANTIALDTLQRDYAAIREQYDQAVANRARAQTGDIIEALSKGERITLVDPAVAPEEPFSPNRPRLAIMGTAGGLALAFGFVVLLEILNTTIRRSQDIVRQLDITPFGTLPYIRTRAERIRRRLLILSALVGVVAVIIGGLWGIDQFVIPLDRALEKIVEQLPAFGLQF
jgi:uncharacterized protein involved in exopolysaccharide biosynthesis